MKKILVIDDDEDLQNVTRIALEEHDFTVISAYTPEEGITKIQSEIPDLVILDVLMPRDFEGFEVARKIREELKLKTLPIIMLTAVHEVKRVPYRFAPHEQWLPVDYFFEKPVESKVLVSKVKEILNIPENT
jgi:DNA-binding response OmpR family regulator